MRKEYEFLAKFALVFAPLYALIRFLPLPPLTDLIASIEYLLLKATGYATTISGSFLTANGQRYLIVNDCSGLVLIALLLALLYATDIPEKTRRKTLLYGAPFLFIFNIFRLYATLAIGASYGLEAMETAHVILWFVDSLVVLAIWYAAFTGRIFAKKRRK